MEIEDWCKDVEDPSWLEPAPDGSILYAVGELSPGGLVSAFAPSHGLVNTVATGAKPTHLAVHPGGRFLFTALFHGGGVAVHPIAPDGSVGPIRDLRPHADAALGDGVSHAHQVVISPGGTHLLAVDLGTDSVHGYRLDAATGCLLATGRTRLATGSGPRHLAFHPSGSHAYVAGELDGTVTVCGWADGVLTPGEVHPCLPAGSGFGSASRPGSGPPNYPGEILVSADGRHVYVSNRGSNTIAVFAVGDDPARLTLLATPACGGDWPRHLALDRTGRWLYSANERSGDLVWFPVDPATGLPGAAAGRLEVPGIAQFLVVP